MQNRTLRPKHAIELPAQRPRWDPQRLRVLTGRICQAGDLILLAAAALTVTILPGRDLLQLRNLFLAAMCISTWRVILMSVGVYSATRTGSPADYLFRYVIALNSCTGVVGLIEVILRPGLDAWHMVEMFWLVALALTGTLRVGLLLFDRLLASRES